ncbi:IS200/IS605 family transposase [Chloroflexota bacterium]
MQYNLECELRYHVVLRTANDLRILKDEIKAILINCFSRLQKREGCEILDYKISPNHVHLLIVMPTIHSVEEVIRDIKEETSLQIGLKYYRRDDCLVWAQGYLISALGDEEPFDFNTWHRNMGFMRRGIVSVTQ